MQWALGVLLLTAAEASSAPVLWRGTMIVQGIGYAPIDYHLNTTTIAVRLREGEVARIPGGLRILLVSDGSTYDVQTAVHDTTGKLVCTGTGRETLTGKAIGYLETRGGTTTYHLTVPRVWGSFGCGRNRTIARNRTAVIGTGDAGEGEVEVADSIRRVLEGHHSLMQGDFRGGSTKAFGGGQYRWEFAVDWRIRREPPHR